MNALSPLSSTTRLLWKAGSTRRNGMLSYGNRAANKKYSYSALFDGERKYMIWTLYEGRGGDHR